MMARTLSFPKLMLVLLLVAAASFYVEAWSAWPHPGAVCTHAQQFGEWLFAGGTAAQGYAVLLALLATALLLLSMWCWQRLKRVESASS
jgi:hypothetical protein